MRLPDGWMSPYEWELWMENTCDELPSWYSDVNLREDAYREYLKDKAQYTLKEMRDDK